jgi:4'-phosphopantetheinyl transferase
VVEGCQHDGIWRPAPLDLALPDGEVHVWRAWLGQAPVERLLPLLAADERARAARLRTEAGRRTSIAGRGVLRYVLGRYLGLPPEHVRFTYTTYGKPALAPAEAGGLRFNLAHARDLALLAIMRTHELGVDVEAVDASVEHERIAARFFSPQEQAALRALPPEQRLAAFFAGWTRKEAYLKARGAGLSLPLDQFSVSLAPEEPPALLELHGPAAEPTRWALHALRPGPGYAAALAVAGPVTRLVCWQWAWPG